MKRIHLILFLLLVQAELGFAQKTSVQGYTLTGIAKGISDGEVELSSYNSKNRTSTTINTTKIKNGKFVLTGKLKGAEMMNLFLSQKIGARKSLWKTVISALTSIRPLQNIMITQNMGKQKERD